MRQFSINIGGAGSGSQGLAIYALLATLPVSSTDGDVVYVLETRKIYSWNNTAGKWVVVGGEGAFIGRVEQTSIPDATQTLAVVFASNMPDTQYSLFLSIKNTTDADPIWLQAVETIKSVSGFTVVFNAPTDSANYVLEWGVAGDAKESYP